MMPVKSSQNWLPGIFNDFFGNEWLEKTNTNAPAVNILENDDEYTVEVAAPGMKKEDFNVRLEDDNQLLVSMEKNEAQNAHELNSRYLRREFSYTQFQQTLILPDNVDKEKISAKVEHGILTIHIPKKTIEEIHNTKTIEIH